MIHARPDYQRIQDPAGLIPPDEPVFLLRAKDVTAPATVEHWAAIQQAAGATDDTLANAAMDHAERMRSWQAAHGSKVADGPHPIAGTTNDAQEHLAQRLYQMADDQARVSYQMPHGALVPWSQSADVVREFYRGMAGRLLRGQP